MLGSAVLLIFVIAAFVLMLGAISQLESANNTASEASGRLALANELEASTIDLETGVRGFLITAEPRFLAPRDQALRRMPEIARLVGSQGAEVGGVSDAPLRQASAAVYSYIREYSNPLVTTARRNLDQARGVVGLGEGKRRVDAIRRQVGDYSAEITKAADAARADAQSSADRAVTLGLIGVIGASLMILLGTALAEVSVISRLRRFVRAAGRIREGDLDVRVEEGGIGEIHILANSLNEMAASLRNTVGELATERDRAEQFQGFVTRLSSEQGELAPLGRAMLDELCRIGRADGACLYVIDARGGTDRMWLACTHGVSAENLPPLIEPGDGLAGRAAVEGQPLAASQAESGLAVGSLAGTNAIRHELHMPLNQGGEVLGVISLGRLADPPFAAEEIDELDSMMGSAAVALANSLSLRAAEDIAELTQSVLESAQEAYVAVDSEGIVLAWNPEAESLFGFTEEEAVGVSLAELIIPAEIREQHHARRRQILEEASHGGRLEVYEVWVEDKALRPLLIEISASTVRRGPGWQVSYFCRDITERSLRDRQLRAEETVSRRLAESDSGSDVVGAIVSALGESFEWPLGCFWEYDERDRILQATRLWNGVGEDAVPLERLTREGQYQPDEPAPVTAVVSRAWESGQPRWASLDSEEAGSARLDAARAAGIGSVLALPLRGSEGVLGVFEFGLTATVAPSEGLLHSLRSITDLVAQVLERRRAQEQAERLKNEFFALVSHELRTPLTSVIGYLDIVREGDAGEINPEQSHYLDVIDRNATRLLRLVGDLLFVAQVEAGTLSLEKGEVDLEQVCLDAVEAARPRAEKLAVGLSAETVPVTVSAGDSDRLGQLLDNLISNALKFTPEDGLVTVRLRHLGERAVLEVTDTGMGISAADQERLFERFYRADKATEQAIPGIGLGLSICRAIVEGHGGTIAIESEEGRGTTFRVELPLEMETATEPQSKVEELPAGAGAPS